MTTLSDAFDQIIKGEASHLLIPCSSPATQESTRVMAYKIKRKAPAAIREEIGISKLTRDDEYYVKLYKRQRFEFLVEGENGKLVPFEPDPSKDPELLRIVGLMEKDGKRVEEIEEFKKNWRKG